MEQISTLQPVEEPPVEQVDVAWRMLQPMESPRRSRPRGARDAAPYLNPQALYITFSPLFLWGCGVGVE